MSSNVLLIASPSKTDAAPASDAATPWVLPKTWVIPPDAATLGDDALITTVFPHIPPRDTRNIVRDGSRSAPDEPSGSTSGD